MHQHVAFLGVPSVNVLLRIHQISLPGKTHIEGGRNKGPESETKQQQQQQQQQHQQQQQQQQQQQHQQQQHQQHQQHGKENSN
jgi:hypothetical protein